MLNGHDKFLLADANTQAVLRPQRFLKTWGDEAVVYDVASGETHYLKPLMFALYQLCRDQPGRTSTELAAALADRLGVEDTPQLQDLIAETLDGLCRIGLLQAA